MDIHGILDSMDIHYSIDIMESIDINGFTWNPWISGIPVESMDIHGFHSYPGIPWISMESMKSMESMDI